MKAYLQTKNIKNAVIGVRGWSRDPTPNPDFFTAIVRRSARRVVMGVNATSRQIEHWLEQAHADSCQTQLAWFIRNKSAYSFSTSKAENLIKFRSS